MKNVKKLLGVFVVMVCALFLVPNDVDANEMSTDFKKILNSDLKFVVNSYQPESEFEAGTILFEYSLIEAGFTNYDIDISTCNSTYTSCDIIYNGTETHTVEIVYNYDKTVKEMIDGYISKIPANKKEFEVRDLELVNFWLNGKGMSKYITNYSSELKDYFDYKNFTLDARRGTSSPFVTGRGGIANLKYDNTIYKLINGFEVNANHIIYVADETENTPEAILMAAQKRIDDYVGTGKAELSYLSTAWDYWVNYHYNNTRDVWQVEQGPNFTIEEFEQMSGVYIPAYPSFEEGFYSELAIAGVNENDLIYILDVPIDENMGDSYELIIRRDSSKMINPSYKTSDAITDITVLSTNSEIPLDTMISAKELTSGEEYDRVNDLLNLTDNLTFDLKLYSSSLDKYVNQLDSGEFEVKIPVPKDFEGKDLVVYYVGASNVAEKHEVEVKEGYAVFKTTHFSIYTLGYKETASSNVKVTFDANGGKFKESDIYIIEDWDYTLYDSIVKPTREGYEFKGYYTEKIDGTKLEMILNEAGIDTDSTFYAHWEKVEENPKTFDSITTSIMVGMISLFGLISATIYLKKRNKVKI